MPHTWPTTIFYQSFGTTMGSSVSVIVIDLVMEDIEDRAFLPIPLHHLLEEVYGRHLIALPNNLVHPIFTPPELYRGYH